MGGNRHGYCEWGVCVYITGLERAECSAGEKWSSGTLDGGGKKSRRKRKERKRAVRRETWTEVTFH